MEPPPRSLRGILFLLHGLVWSALPLSAQSAVPLTWPGPNEDDTPAETLPVNVTYTPTLGQAIEPAVDDPKLHPPAGRGNGSRIVPIGLGPLASSPSGFSVAPSFHYFNYNGDRLVLVGVSADNACHFNMTGTGQCNYSNYTTFINDLAAQGLNVMRLWVSLVGGPGDTGTCRAVTGGENDNPFVYDGTNPGADGLGRWRLDTRNANYFSRLANVVAYAQSKNVIVEVTLFSPQTGLLGVGPYAHAHAFLANGTQLRGFSDTASFTNAGSADYAAMKSYLFNVVHWTVDALWPFPNLYFEIANEPENVTPTAVLPCGWGTTSQTDPTTVAAWQKAIANELTNYEQVNYVQTGKLVVRHIVAFEPSTTTAADTFVGSGVNATPGSAINSHYTVIKPSTTTNPDLSGVGLGAIKLIRLYYNQGYIFGFNETKITGGSGCVSPSTAETVDAGRAEAWEFMVNQGGVYDQFGYNCNASDYAETRRQMGVLRRFLSNFPVQIYLGAATSNPTSPNWINPGAYGVQESASQKYWAALEPAGSWAAQRWLLYIHHSKDRLITFDGYTAVVTPTPTYQEHLSVCLGAASATYKVRWFDPRNAVDTAGTLTPLRTDTLSWPGATTCTPGGGGSLPLQASPLYNYDLAVLISP